MNRDGTGILRERMMVVVFNERSPKVFGQERVLISTSIANEFINLSSHG